MNGTQIAVAALWGGAMLLLTARWVGTLGSRRDQSPSLLVFAAALALPLLLYVADAARGRCLCRALTPLERSIADSALQGARSFPGRTLTWYRVVAVEVNAGRGLCGGTYHRNGRAYDAYRVVIQPYRLTGLPSDYHLVRDCGGGSYRRRAGAAPARSDPGM